MKECVRAYVEGIENGFTPFNRGSLPIVSGISIEIKEKDGTYALQRVRKDGKEIKDEDTYQVTCLNTVDYMTPLLEEKAFALEMNELRVKEEWTSYIKEGGILAEPESYITLK